MKVCKLSARSPPCTKVCTKTSLSRYYTHRFCIKQYDFHLLIYSQPPVVRHFTNWWHLSYFPWTTAFIRTFATSILWCYNFNGMIKMVRHFVRHPVFMSLCSVSVKLNSLNNIAKNIRQHWNETVSCLESTDIQGVSGVICHSSAESSLG